MEADTNDYKSPYYADLNAQTSQRYGLPDGLLHSIVTRGERSNADQVSSAGARTVYQITQDTRDSALKKWGIDAYLNPENAATVAGRVLKESLDRNKGVAPLAVAEYIGGTDPKNWGPTTRDYVKRVTGAPIAAGPDPKQSTYDKIMAKRQDAATPSIARVVDAYKSGRMDPESKAAFEADVNAGRVLLPRGVELDTPAKPAQPTANAAGTQMAPAGVIEAYQSGAMSPEEAHEFETDVAEKRIAVPEGTQIAAPAGIVSRAADATFEAVSGAKRSTTESETLPEWTRMPEMNATLPGSDKTPFWDRLKAAAGTLMTGPKETVQILQKQFPGMEARQDAKGNYILKSPSDGKEYVIPPGFSYGDIPRAGSAALAYGAGGAVAGVGKTLLGTAARQAAGAALTETAIQGTQAATGGEFDKKDVALAAAAAGALPVAGRAAEAVIDAAKPAVAAGVDALKSRLPQAAARAESGIVDAAGRPIAPAAPAGVPPPAPEVIPGSTAPAAPLAPELTVPEGGAPAAAAPRPGAPEVLPPGTGPAAPIAPELTAPTMTAEQLAETTRKASGGGMGSGKATERLASEATPDAETVAAADRLGVLDHLQADHVTSNDAFRTLAAVVKSVPMSEGKQAEVEGLRRIAERADGVIQELGGGHDLSALSEKLKSTLQGAYDEAKAKAKGIFKQLEAKIDPVTPTPATDTLAFINENARKLGSADNLSAGEKDLLKKLAPKDGKEPTYALIDSERKAANAAKYNNQSPFASMDSNLRDRLIEAMRADQGRIVETLGAGEAWGMANDATKVYKGIENSMKKLFGEKLEKSIVGPLSNAVKQLGAQDVANFVKLIKLTPESMRHEVVASGLTAAFDSLGRKGGMDFGKYVQWYEGLSRSPTAKAALLANLPEGAAQRLADLYKVAKGIHMSTTQFISTGRLATAPIKQVLEADNLMQHIFNIAKRTGIAEAATSAVGLPGFGTVAAVTSALAKGRTSAMKAADQLINSPEFIAAARNASKNNIARLARSKTFTKFMRESKGPQSLSERERWINTALQAKRNEKK